MHLPLHDDGSNAREDTRRSASSPPGTAGCPVRISELDDYLAAFVDDYAGLRVTGPTGVEVRLVRLSAVSRRELCARFPEISISFAPAWYSMASSNRLTQEIWADRLAWNESGVELMESWIDDYGLVVLGIRDPEASEHLLFDRYGDSRVRVVKGEEVSAL